MTTNPLRSFPPSERARTLTAWILLAVILASAGMLRFYRLADGLGGYQGYTEAKTIMVAESMLAGSRLQESAEVRAMGLAPAPVLSFIVYVFMGLPIPALLIARLIVLLFGLLGIFLVFDLGRRLFDPAVGCIAAALYAFTPIGSLLGRNAQAETLAIALMLLGHWLLLRSNPNPEAERLQGAPRAGLVLGLGVLVHPFVLVTLPAWLAFECLKRRSLVAGMKNSGLWMMTGLALLPSVLLYGYHSLRHPRELFAAAWGSAVWLAPALSKTELSEFPLEFFWAYSPFIAALFLLGLLWSLRRPAWQQLFLLLQTGAYLALALLLYRDNTHLIWLTPFAALYSAAMLWRIRRRAVALGLTSVIIAQGMLVSLLLLCNIKYGFTDFSQLLNYYKIACNRCMILVRDGFFDSHLRELQYYFGPDRIVNLDRAELDAQNQLLIESLNDRVYLYFIVSSMGSGGDFDVSREIYAPMLFGVEILGSSPNVQRFNPGSISFSKKRPWTYFEVVESRLMPNIAMIKISRSAIISRANNRITFKEPQ